MRVEPERRFHLFRVFSRSRGFLAAGLTGLAAPLAAQDRPAAIPPALPLDETPFKPDMLFLTWQRDPTTTIQWISKTADDPVIRYAEHRLEGEQRFHLALNEHGKILDVTRTGKMPRYRSTTGAGR